MNDKHVEWIDIAKGIGIIAVVYAHMNIPDKLRAVIYTFHVPLFFFLSGYTSTYSNDISFKEYVIIQLKRFMKPYLIFGLILIVGGEYWIQFHTVVHL